MGVYKNTLMSRTGERRSFLSWATFSPAPSAFVFATGDPVASAKAIKDFAKKNENLVIKGGMMDGCLRRCRGRGYRSPSFPRGAHRQAARHHQQPHGQDGPRLQRPHGVLRSRGFRYRGPEVCSIKLHRAA